MNLTTRVTTSPEEAARCLVRGGTVAIPTETVYGLAALATDDSAIRKVFEAKGRPMNHPLIVHVSSLDMARRFGDFSPSAEALACKFWPGPLTLVVERTPLVSDAVTGGRDTVALRVPRHLATQRVIDICGTGIVAPSANVFGHVSPTSVAHVLHDLGGRIDMILDGGDCEVGVESTIVECSGELQVLRPGAISVTEIESCTGRIVMPTTGESRAAGMLTSHYAPRARVHLVTDAREADSLKAEMARAGRSSVIIGRDITVTDYAATLYRQMRTADAEGAQDIIALLPSGDGLAAAVRDRLTKAAADTSGIGD